MFIGLRAWLLGVAAVIGVVALGAAALFFTDNSSTQPPRVRVSVPWLETDRFADESAGVSDVASYEGVDQLQAAFNADAGHPRLILLVDPI